MACSGCAFRQAPLGGSGCAQLRKPLSAAALWVVFLLALVGLYFGLSGVIMTGSFAVAGPAATSDETLAYWKHVQLWYDGITLVSLGLAVACAVRLFHRRPQAAVEREPIRQHRDRAI